MAKKEEKPKKSVQAPCKPSSLVDTRVIYCGDNLDQLKKFPDHCIDLIYIDPLFTFCDSHKIAEIANKINSNDLKENFL